MPMPVVSVWRCNAINAESANYHDSLEHQKDTWLIFLNDTEAFFTADLVLDQR